MDLTKLKIRDPLVSSGSSIATTTVQNRKTPVLSASSNSITTNPITNNRVENINVNTAKNTTQVREIDPRTVQVYEHLFAQIKDTNPMSHEECKKLCEKISKLKKEAITVHELICYHHSKYGSTKVVRNRAFPYKDMKEQGHDIIVYPDQLPNELLLLLNKYVELVNDDSVVEEDD